MVKMIGLTSSNSVGCIWCLVLDSQFTCRCPLLCLDRCFAVNNKPLCLYLKVIISVSVCIMKQ